MCCQTAPPPPVPGLSLLGAEGLAALNVLRLLEQDVGELDQVVDPHGPISCDPQHPFTAPRHPLGQRQVLHGQQESGRRTGTRGVRFQGFLLLELLQSV